MPVFDKTSFIFAKRAMRKSNTANTDVAALQAQVNAMQATITQMGTQITAMEQTISDQTQAITVLQNHTHAYVDVDNSGTAINRTTQTPS